MSNHYKTRIQISENVKTGTDAQKAAIERTEQAISNAEYKPNILTGKNIQTRDSLYSELSKYQNKPIGAFNQTGNQVLGLMQKTFNQDHGLGTEAMTQAIGGAMAANALLKSTEKAGLVVGNNVKTAVTSSKKVVVKSANTIHAVTRGIHSGTLTASVAKDALLRARDKMVINVKLKAAAGVKGLGKGIVHGTSTSVSKGITSTGGLLSRSDDMAVQGVGNSMNLTYQGIKTSVAGSKLSGRVVKTSVKKGVSTFKTVGRGASYIKNKGLRAAWNRARLSAQKAAVGTAKSVVSFFISLAKSAAKKMILPLIMVTVIVLAITSTITTPMMAVGSIFGSVFGTSDSDNEYDVREYITRADGIPALREEFINNLMSGWQNKLKSNGGNYDSVRVYTEQSDTVIDANAAGLSNAFYTNDELANIIQPIFNAVILMEYDLEPTEAQADELLRTIFYTLFGVNESESSETQTVTQTVQAGESLGTVVTSAYCGCTICCGINASGITASGERATADHTIAVDANNPIVPMGTKIIMDGTEYTVEDTGNFSRFGVAFDIYFSDHTTALAWGHKNIEAYLAEGNTNTVEVISEIEAKILDVTVNMDGLYQLLAIYFTDPIDQLSNLSYRTPEQEEQLTTLKDYYEICLEYINEVNATYNVGGGSMADLGGVQWVDGNRVANQALVDLALTQLGQTGGQPYWSAYGFSGRVAWCACFVQWCMNQSGVGDQYAHSANNAYCPTLVTWFKSNGRWGEGGYTDLVAGDTIFFDWEGDGVSDHIGIVIGRDDTYVYTIEGNSGDAVKQKQYPLNSSVIMGYGLMNY